MGLLALVGRRSAAEARHAGVVPARSFRCSPRAGQVVSSWPWRRCWRRRAAAAHANPRPRLGLFALPTGLICCSPTGHGAGVPRHPMGCGSCRPGPGHLLITPWGDAVVGVLNSTCSRSTSRSTDDVSYSRAGLQGEATTPPSPWPDRAGGVWEGFLRAPRPARLPRAAHRLHLTAVGEELGFVGRARSSAAGVMCVRICYRPMRTTGSAASRWAFFDAGSRSSRTWDDDGIMRSRLTCRFMTTEARRSSPRAGRGAGET